MTIPTATKQQRDSNIELLRIMVMGMIVLHHFIFHGLGVYRNLIFDEPAVLNARDTNYALVVDSFMICAVNVFVLISGWFSIKFRAAGFVKLFAICSFFAVLGYSISLYRNGIPVGGGIALRMIKRGTFVISSRTWWFVQLYFLLMFLSEPINRYIEQSSRKSLQYVIGVFVFLNVYLGWIQGVEYVKDGYNLFNFIMLYLIGRYLRLYWKNDYKVGIDTAVYVLSSAGTALLALALNYWGRDVFMALSYNSPFVILSAISMLLLFTKLHFTSKIVNYFASSCLAIYLFQEGGYNFYEKIRAMYITEESIAPFILMIIVYFGLSMLIPVVIDKLRLLVFGRAETKMSGLLDRKCFRKLGICTQKRN